MAAAHSHFFFFYVCVSGYCLQLLYVNGVCIKAKWKKKNHYVETSVEICMLIFSLTELINIRNQNPLSK